MKLLKSFSGDLTETVSINNNEFNAIQADVYYTSDKTEAGFLIDLSFIYRLRVDGVIKDKKVIVHIKQVYFAKVYSVKAYTVAKETAASELTTALNYFNNSIAQRNEQILNLSDFKKNITFTEYPINNVDII